MNDLQKQAETEPSPTSRHGKVGWVRASRAATACLLAILGLFLWHGGTSSAPPSLGHDTAALEPLPPTSFTPAVSEAIQGIDTDTLTGYVADLSGERPVSVAGQTVTLATRYSLAEAAIHQAEVYARERFEALGFEATCHSYQLETTTRCNIVAKQTGSLAPEKIVILGAHLDSITQSPIDRLTSAPGADDNASGVAAVLAAAGVLRDYPLPFTVHYVLFTGEEQGLYGSRAYAESLSSAGAEVVAVVNLDMIGYNTGEPEIDVHVRTGTGGVSDMVIAEVFSRTLMTYNLGLLPEVVPSGTTASDHAAFWAEGYPAVLIIEDWEDGDSTPHYHTTEDLLTTFDVAYFTRSAKATAATVMQLAGVVDFVSKPALVTAAHPVTLWAITHLPESMPVTYSWDLGNGTLLYGPMVTSTFSFAQYPATRGSWQVTMTVTYGEEAVRISKQLPVYQWDLRLPWVLRMM